MKKAIAIAATIQAVRRAPASGVRVHPSPRQPDRVQALSAFLHPFFR
jgi:hypothetical protein